MVSHHRSEPDTAALERAACLLRRSDELLAQGLDSDLAKRQQLLEVKLARDALETKRIKLARYEEGIRKARRELTEACERSTRALGRALP